MLIEQEEAAAAAIRQKEPAWASEPRRLKGARARTYNTARARSFTREREEGASEREQRDRAKCISEWKEEVRADAEGDGGFGRREGESERRASAPRVPPFAPASERLGRCGGGVSR